MSRDLDKTKKEQDNAAYFRSSNFDEPSRKHVDSQNGDSPESWLKRIEKSGLQAERAIDIWKRVLFHLLSFALLSIMAWEILKRKLGL